MWPSPIPEFAYVVLAGNSLCSQCNKSGKEDEVIPYLGERYDVKARYMRVVPNRLHTFSMSGHDVET